MVHQRGVEVDQTKVKAIISAKAPQNKKTLEVFGSGELFKEVHLKSGRED